MTDLSPTLGCAPCEPYRHIPHVYTHTLTHSHTQAHTYTRTHAQAHTQLNLGRTLKDAKLIHNFSSYRYFEFTILTPRMPFSTNMCKAVEVCLKPSEIIGNSALVPNCHLSLQVYLSTVQARWTNLTPPAEELYMIGNQRKPLLCVIKSVCFISTENLVCAGKALLFTTTVVCSPSQGS